MKILLAGAMPSENEFIIQSLKLKHIKPIGNFYPLFYSNFASHDIYLVQTFVGSIHAPSAVSLSINQLKPDLVIKVGCVGGNSPGIKKNDLIIPTLFFHSGSWLTRSVQDNKPTSDASLWQQLYGDLPYQNSNENLGGLPYTFVPDKKFTQIYRLLLNEKNLPYIDVALGSGDMVICDRKVIENIQSTIVGTRNPWCTDNESYAIAFVCAIHKIPFTGIYFVASSDYDDIDGYDSASISRQTKDTITPLLSEYIKDLES